jgi:hypothetical protein
LNAVVKNHRNERRAGKDDVPTYPEVVDLTSSRLLTDGLEARWAVSDSIRGAGSSIKGPLERKAKNAMAVAVNNRAPKVALGATGTRRTARSYS